jgi:hypothetical protein
VLPICAVDSCVVLGVILNVVVCAFESGSVTMQNIDSKSKTMGNMVIGFNSLVSFAFEWSSGDIYDTQIVDRVLHTIYRKKKR